MNETLLNRVLQHPRLPSLPSIALDVIDLVQRPDVNVRQIASTIGNDPALASKILKTVNSSFYGQAYAVSTITHALVVLGLNSVKTLALGFSLVNSIKDAASGAPGFDHMGYWKRSLYTASAARDMGKRVGLVQQEEAFLGGLMQDIGLLALQQTIGEPYVRLLAQAGSDHRKLIELERAALDLDHAEVGAAMAEQWKLPPVLVAPIRHHEDPQSAPPEIAPLARCVALGNKVADVFVGDNPGEALNGYYESVERWFGLDADAAEPLLKNFHQATNEMRRLFDLPTGELGNPDEILARANEALLNITLQTQQQTTQLQQKNQELVQQALTDTLTGAANRRHFNEFIADQFTKAGMVEPLSVLFLDTDHFKKFNDTYGHPTGDRVLVELARVLKEFMPPPALVARYGGEEFAVVLPNTDRKTAARLAEGVRQKLEQTVVTSDEGQSLRITASIGVATYEGEFFERVEQLIKAADQGVYAAKAAGRNCVRIFTPKPKAA